MNKCHICGDHICRHRGVSGSQDVGVAAGGSSSLAQTFLSNGSAVGISTTTPITGNYCMLCNGYHTTATTCASIRKLEQEQDAMTKEMQECAEYYSKPCRS